MKQHKWHKEIKAWADGAEIEVSIHCENEYGEYAWSKWTTDKDPEWETVDYEYRIKPQPKEPQYLNVYGWLENENICFNKSSDYPYIGKIKLEQDDD